MSILKMDRVEIATIIYNRLFKEKENLSLQYKNTKEGIGCFYLDGILSDDLAKEISEGFPAKDKMILKKSMREYKYIAAQMDKYNPLLEKVIYAFQDQRIVKIIGEICGINNLEPDENLYAGGISLMAENNFLNPHLDNSHDKDRNRWRVLNLLYYVSQDWEDDFGGHLELWPNGINNTQHTIYSRFNRLVVMATHNNSLHSVSPVIVDNERKCVSNYYFSDTSLQAKDKFHVTSFRGRPEQKATDVFLKLDAKIRMMLRRVFKKGVVENPHVYKKDK